MPRFCTTCGTPAPSDAVKFCAKCGASLAPAPAAQLQPPSPAQPPAPSPHAQPSAPVMSAPAAAPAKSGGAFVKILAAVLGVFVLVGLLSLGTCVYIGYRVKKRVDQTEAKYGLDKPLASGPAVAARNVCSLLTKEEVSQATGVTITDAQGSTQNCVYSTSSNPSVFEDSVTWQGGALAYKLAGGTLKMQTAGTPVIQSIPGIGDEAFSMSPFQGADKQKFQQDMKADNSGFLQGMNNIIGRAPLFFRKGDVMVSITIGQATDPDKAKRDLASKIASRL